jgi:hypothetical protein
VKSDKKGFRKSFTTNGNEPFGPDKRKSLQEPSLPKPFHIIYKRRREEEAV